MTFLPPQGTGKVCFVACPETAPLCECRERLAHETYVSEDELRETAKLLDLPHQSEITRRAVLSVRYYRSIVQRWVGAPSRPG